jgi:class 3 adenylate cyclase/predicted ATPase
VDIAAWLSGLGLERYADAFRENAIGFDVLPQLTDEHLKDLGLPLGDRLRLLKAAAVLAGPAEPRSAAEAKPGTSPEPTLTARPVEAERRQLTVLFCDLVGSTELSARLDPEDMAAVIRAYQGCCSEAVGRWGGHVAKYMGDGMLAYFGWPKAHEDEAERAVRAGRAIAEAVAALKTPAGDPLAARVGIATGLVMVGELIGEGAAQEQAVVGETPNLAARLQALAAPGSVVISQATRRLVGGLFALADLGPQRLKGFAEPLSAWRVEGEGRADGRFEALHGERLTPLVGREHELGILLERWAWAKDGDGQVVLLSGEAGIGKSRVVRALGERLGDEPHVAISHFCSPHHSNSALYPFIAQLERAAELKAQDEPEAKLAKLEALLGQATSALDEAVPLIAALLGIPAGERYPPLNLSPQQQKQRTLEVLLEQLEGLARQRPVLELYEDVHWIDPSSLELLDLLVERVRRLPVLALLTFRPDFQPSWTAHAHVTTLTMGRLGRRQGADLVARVTGDKSLPAAVVEQIVARTDGVPLFVEELTKTVLESDLLADGGDHWELSGPLPPLAIPTTLHDSLMARLDRLAPVKEVAQIGAVIGRDFSHELLAAVLPLPKDQLSHALSQLVASGLVFRRGAPPGATYTFKHALVQDAAYQSLLKSKRQQLHSRIAGVLEERFGELATQQPEILAHHFAEAGAAEQAVSYGQEAGTRASERFAYVEAVAHFKKALRLLRDLSASSERDHKELSLWLALGPALMSCRNWAAPEVREAYLRAHELSHDIGEPEQVFTATWGLWTLWTHNVHSPELEVAQRLASELVTVAEGHASPEMLLQAHHASWTTLELLGEAASCLKHAVQGRTLYREERHRETLLYGGHDAGVCARFHEATALWQLGYPDKALDSARDALALAERLGHPLSLILALFYVASTHWLRRETDSAQRSALDVIAVCRRHDIPHYLGAAEVVVGWSRAMVQDAAGVAEIQRGLADLDAGGPPLRKGDCLLMLVEACYSLCEFEQALAALEQVWTFFLETGLRRSLAEVARLEGSLLLAKPNREPDRAESCFAKALETARAQDLRSMELRAATSLARLWSEQGERRKAYDLLAPVYGWFTEGFDTADLKDAKALLEELP